MTKISEMAGPIRIESLIREKSITDIAFILSLRGRVQFEAEAISFALGIASSKKALLAMTSYLKDSRRQLPWLSPG